MSSKRTGSFYTEIAKEVLKCCGKKYIIDKAPWFRFLGLEYEHQTIRRNSFIAKNKNC
jgi:hypothetical protein